MKVNHNDIGERLIISLYDYTETWPKHYIEAGYPVLIWDKKVEGDILTDDFMHDVMIYSDYVYGILAAPPCTFFAVSGARWWQNISDDDLSEMIMLAEWVLMVKDWCPNLKFWALENPVGRIDKLIPELKPFRKLLFNPCDYGDPYTKKTVLWGEFNHNLPKTPVLPLYGSLMHKTPGSSRQAEIRSKTPGGFAKAFFQANQ
jgi:hypothetical protein